MTNSSLVRNSAAWAFVKRASPPARVPTPAPRPQSWRSSIGARPSPVPPTPMPTLPPRPNTGVPMPTLPRPQESPEWVARHTLPNGVRLLPSEHRGKGKWANPLSKKPAQ